MDRDIYLIDPCKASSLPFWKTEMVTVPDFLKIIRIMNIGKTETNTKHILTNRISS